ncbi:MAG: DUF4293 family protein [Cytophagales bacterium]|nr:MAG: DUF4293 family protein [Cytophagales bacterium]
MIQRIQSLFLTGIFITMILSFFTTFWKATAIEKSTGISGNIELNALAIHFIPHGQATFESKGDTYYIAALVLLIALTSMYALLQYKNRRLQIKLSSLNYLLLSGLIGLFFLAIDKTKVIFETSLITYSIGFYLPLIGIVMNFFALKYIKKDEELIRSVDRIR